MIKNKIITYISFAKKSGSLFIGFNAVNSSILSEKVSLIALLDDASEKTKKEIQRNCNKKNLRCITLPIKSEEVEHIFYRKVVVFSISDKNLSSAILKILS